MRIKNVLQYLEITAARLGDKPAFSAGVGLETLSFSELLRVARCTGSALLEQGARGERVAILAERAPHTVAAMLGVWYAGGISVVLDDSMPVARMQEMVQQSRAALVIADEKNTVRARELGVAVCELPALLAHGENEKALLAVRRMQIDTDPLYVVYTSGSTGRPKGVVACHRSVIDYAQALTQALEIRESDVFGCQAPLFYDASLKEILSTLVCGATTYLIPRRCFAFPPLLLDYLQEQRINIVCWVASALMQISSLGALEARPPLTLQKVVFGGEVFPREHYDRWRAALPQAQFYQLYGPSEATGMSCVWRADRALEQGEKIPIGAPLDNTDAMLIASDRTRILPLPGEESAQGELYLRGSCVTLGYDAEPQATAAAYVQHPLHDAYPEIVYRTGDLARYNAHGELVFLSRCDAQIKHMGHRIELGEIESSAAGLPEVREACCLYDAEKREIVLFYVGDAAREKLLATLKARLPSYMLPGKIVKLDAFSYLPNGKKDRRALLALAMDGTL